MPEGIWTWSCETFFSSWISKEAALIKTMVKLYLSADIKMLLMIEIDIREGICHSTYRDAKVNNKYKKNYD